MTYLEKRSLSLIFRGRLYQCSGRKVWKRDAKGLTGNLAAPVGESPWEVRKAEVLREKKTTSRKHKLRGKKRDRWAGGSFRGLEPGKKRLKKPGDISIWSLYSPASNLLNGKFLRCTIAEKNC